MKVIILRGVPGSGKSTYVKQKFPNGIVCSADHYMVDIYGDYSFNPKKLGYAHAACFGKFTDALEKGNDLIVLDNTNIKLSWFKEYIDLAKEYGADIEILRFDIDPVVAYNRNVHNVPLETISKNSEILKNQPLMENEYVIS